ncbi:hypothetical protein L917_16579, partial [Phytophthora nicotianae]
MAALRSTARADLRTLEPSSRPRAATSTSVRATAQRWWTRLARSWPASTRSTGLLRLLTPTARPSARRTATSAPDLAASNLGIVSDSRASSKKYWTPERNRNGDNAKVHLIHFALNATSGVDIILDGTGAK